MSLTWRLPNHLAPSPQPSPQWGKGAKKMGTGIKPTPKLITLCCKELFNRLGKDNKHGGHNSGDT